MMGTTHHEQPSLRSNLPWMGLFLLFLGLGFLFSIVQPLTRIPDEAAHAQYIRFLAYEHRLPRWEVIGGGEAGYEAQHPPLYYAVGAVVYSLASALPENWRWYVLRWYTLAIGAALFWVTKRFSMEYFDGKRLPALATTAAFMFMPVTLQYASHITVDGASALICSASLWLSIRVARGRATRRDRAALGVVLGLGLLTKMTALGALVAAAFAHILDSDVDPGKKWEQRRMRLFCTLLIAGVISGWWYIRNAWLYGVPFPHTFNNIGSGIELAAVGGWPRSVWLVIRETCLSAWAQRGWLPPGAVEIGLYSLLTALILLAVWAVVRGRQESKGQSSAYDPAPLLCGCFLAVFVVGQQFQVWFVDIGWNAGGRYLLNAMMGACALVVGSLCRPRGRKAWLTAFVGVLLAMDVVSAHRIWTTLNPRYAPGWKVFRFPSDYDPAYRRGRDQLELKHLPRSGAQ